MIGYRLGQSPAGRRIEQAGLAFEARHAKPPALPPPSAPAAVLKRPRKAVRQSWGRLSPLDKIARTRCLIIIAEVARSNRLTPYQVTRKWARTKLPPELARRVRHEAMYRCSTETVASLELMQRLFYRYHVDEIIYGATQFALLTNRPMPDNFPPYKIKNRDGC